MTCYNWVLLLQFPLLKTQIIVWVLSWHFHIDVWKAASLQTAWSADNPTISVCFFCLDMAKLWLPSFITLGVVRICLYVAIKLQLMLLVLYIAWCIDDTFLISFLCLDLNYSSHLLPISSYSPDSALYRMFIQFNVLPELLSDIIRTVRQVPLRVLCVMSFHLAFSPQCSRPLCFVVTIS